jgi:hypothetical protein
MSSPASASTTALSSAPTVSWTSNADMFKFKNADGFWTIYKRCIDRTSGGFRYNVGPGYIARFTKGSTVYVNDYRGRADTGTPGYLNAVNGGLGTFGWHHARGLAGNVPAGDDPTTPGTEPTTGDDGRSPHAVIEGRMCANLTAGYGVCARSWMGPTRQTNGRVDFTMDVWLRDGTDPSGCPTNAIARVRYRYSFYRSSVRAWMSVTTYASANGSGTPYVKEPKFTAVLRGGNYTRISILLENGSFWGSVMEGQPEGTQVLTTGHSDALTRTRTRWDFGTSTTTQQSDSQACASALCFNVVMRAYPAGTNGNVARFGQTHRWEDNAANLGLDRWAELSGTRAKAYPRDTTGDNQVSSCGISPVTDVNGDGSITDFDRSKASEAASPSLDIRRRWEHGGFKSGGTSGPYQAAFTFFTAWEDDRGPKDCEPVQRAFGSSGESFGSFASYSLGSGWTIQ